MAYPYRLSRTIQEDGFGSGYVFYMKPGGVEEKHYHDGIEIVHVIRGICKTHKEGKTYIYQPGEVHEVINDSNDEMVFVCLTIPPESNENTHYLDLG